MYTKVQTLNPLCHKQHDMLYIVDRQQVLKWLNGITVGEFGCSGILAHRNSNCSQAGLGWHIELYIPQISTQASCLPLRPITIIISSATRLMQNKTRKIGSAFKLLFVFECCRCWNPPKTSLQEIRKCCLRATITVLTTCWCCDGNISPISPIIRGNLIEHASYYRFNSAITTGIQVSCCETATRWLWITSSCVCALLHVLPLLSLLFFPAPVFYFGNTDYHVDESDGFVEVQVWRTGTDLSKGGTVTVRSRKTDPVSADGMWRCKVPFSDSFS